MITEVNSQIRSFQFGDEPELIHIIKSGFPDKYLVIHEDPFMLGEAEILTKEKIKLKYKINFDFDENLPNIFI